MVEEADRVLAAGCSAGSRRRREGLPAPARAAARPSGRSATVAAEEAEDGPRTRSLRPAADHRSSRSRRSYWFSRSSSSGTARMTRAGFPTTSIRGSTSFVTTAPAPTNASSPISMPGSRTAPPPMRAPRRIVGPLIERVALLRASHVVVVRRDDARRDEDVLLERRVRGDVRLGLDLRHRPDRRVVLDERAAADHDVVADRDALAHARLVAEDDALADRRPGEDDGAGGDDRPRADLRRRQRLALRGRARRERRLLPDDGVLEHLHALAEHRARVDDRGRVDLSAIERRRQHLEGANDAGAVARDRCAGRARRRRARGSTSTRGAAARSSRSSGSRCRRRRARRCVPARFS